MDCGLRLVANGDVCRFSAGGCLLGRALGMPGDGSSSAGANPWAWEVPKLQGTQHSNEAVVGGDALQC